MRVNFRFVHACNRNMCTEFLVSFCALIFSPLSNLACIHCICTDKKNYCPVKHDPTEEVDGKLRNRA